MERSKISFTVPEHNIEFKATGTPELVTNAFNGFVNNLDSFVSAAKEIEHTATQPQDLVVSQTTSYWIDAIKAIKDKTAVFHVGDMFRELLANDKTVTMVITDVNERAYRFESRECMGIETSADGLDGFLEKVWTLLPCYVKDNIMLTNRHIENPDGTVTEKACRIFVPAASEIFDEDDCYGQDIYKQLDWYKDIRNRIRMVEDESKETHWYWTSSPRSDYSAYFCSVNSNGNASGDVAGAARGLAPFGCWISKS